ncbi:MAG: DMT family transporter [Burkholderiales bacterium]
MNESRAATPSNTSETVAAPSVSQGIAFLLVAVLGWGLVWPINKVVLESMSPYWFAAIRSAIGAAALLVISMPGGRLVLPLRSDMPVLLSITLLHMVGFALLASIGLQLVPVGRSVVLAYTTPLWVMPAAALFLGERLTLRRAIGVALGLLGLAVLFNPFAFDWNERTSVIGHATLLLAAFCWAASIVHIRGHTWHSTPFQLVPWEALLATVILFLIAPLAEPWAAVDWNAKLIVLLIASSILGVAIPYWAIAMAGRRLSAITVSQGLLGAPIVGIAVATIALGEVPDLSVWIALVLVIGGVALGTMSGRPSRGFSRSAD